MRFKTSPFYQSLALAALVSTPIISAFAGGHGGGNGGNAVVCFSDPKIPEKILSLPEKDRVIPNEALSKITSIEALDLLEAEFRRGDVDDAGGPVALIHSNSGEKASDFIQRVASRFDPALPILSQRIRNGLEQLAGRVVHHAMGKNRAEGGPVSGVAQVYDVGGIPYRIDSNRCVLSTVAYQTGNGDELRLDIDDRLYRHPKHSDFSRKALMLHEILYVWGRSIGQAESTGVRKLVALSLRKNVLRSEVAQVLRDYFFSADRRGSVMENFYPEAPVYETFVMKAQTLVLGLSRDYEAAKQTASREAEKAYDEHESALILSGAGVTTMPAIKDPRTRRERKFNQARAEAAENLKIADAQLADALAKTAIPPNSIEEKWKNEEPKLEADFRDSVQNRLDVAVGRPCFRNAETVALFLEKFRKAVEDDFHFDVTGDSGTASMRIRNIGFPACDDFMLPTLE